MEILWSVISFVLYCMGAMLSIGAGFMFVAWLVVRKFIPQSWPTERQMAAEKKCGRVICWIGVILSVIVTHIAILHNL